MKVNDAQKEVLNAIPAKDGYFCLSVMEGLDGKPEVYREPVIAWVISQTIDKSANCPCYPYIFGGLIPVTLESYFSNDETKVILCPDGRVIETEGSTWESESDWFAGQKGSNHG